MKMLVALLIAILIFFLIAGSKKSYYIWDYRPVVPNTPAEVGRDGPPGNLFQIPNQFI
jgi:hypothetical protein